MKVLNFIATILLIALYLNYRVIYFFALGKQIRSFNDWFNYDSGKELKITMIANLLILSIYLIGWFYTIICILALLTINSIVWAVHTWLNRSKSTKPTSDQQ